ncbi:MAG: AMP-binding protein, partial [bacterium]|nr:AMP-binding protein [bacterium]
VVRVLRRAPFASVRHVVTVGRRWFWGGATLSGLAARASEQYAVQTTQADETAAILFTSGSTGPAKGVVYTHGMFDAQVLAIRDQYGIKPGEVDLAAFPLFALFGPALGMTSVVPDMDPSKPATVNPERIVQAVQDHAVTNTFGSPAIWERVSRYCAERGITLPTLRRVLIAGAPVSAQLIERVHKLLDSSADVHTPYGATEALPVSSVGGREVLREHREATRRGAGVCVGKPLSGVTLRIIGLSDDPIEVWSDDLVLPTGEIGEIAVRGDVVTRAYDGLKQATALAKIRESATVWHRMGDVGYLDGEGRLWFCGRKAHRVTTAGETMFSVRCEAIYNEHPKVYRSALVGVGAPGDQEPVMVIEPEPGEFPTSARQLEFWGELLELSRANELTADITQVLFHPAFPVDVRHNAKIDREALAGWATEQLR